MAKKEKCEVDRDTQRERDRGRKSRSLHQSLRKAEWQPVLPWDCCHRSEPPLTWDLLTATISQSRKDKDRTGEKKLRAKDKGRGESLVGKEGKKREASGAVG